MGDFQFVNVDHRNTNLWALPGHAKYRPRFATTGSLIDLAKDLGLEFSIELVSVFRRDMG